MFREIYKINDVNPAVVLECFVGNTEQSNSVMKLLLI